MNCSRRWKKSEIIVLNFNKNSLKSKKNWTKRKKKVFRIETLEPFVASYRWTCIFFLTVSYWKGRCHVTPNATVARSNQSLAVISAIQQSPSQQPSPGSALTRSASRKRKNSSTHRPKERMHHNIPHRYESYRWPFGKWTALCQSYCQNFSLKSVTKFCFFIASRSCLTCGRPAVLFVSTAYCLEDKYQNAQVKIEEEEEGVDTWSY